MKTIGRYFWFGLLFVLDKIANIFRRKKDA